MPSHLQYVWFFALLHILHMGQGNLIVIPITQRFPSQLSVGSPTQRQEDCFGERQADGTDMECLPSAIGYSDDNRYWNLKNQSINECFSSDTSPAAGRLLMLPRLAVDGQASWILPTSRRI